MKIIAILVVAGVLGVIVYFAAMVVCAVRQMYIDENATLKKQGKYPQGLAVCKKCGKIYQCTVWCAGICSDCHRASDENRPPMGQDIP